MRNGTMIAGAALLLALAVSLSAMAGQKGAAGKGQLMQRLIAADTNGDGRLTLEEAKAAFPNGTQEQFNRLDRNQDGVLSVADKPKENGQAGAKRGEIIQRLRAADTNNDAKVTFDEAEAAFPNGTQEQFNKLDRNHDGVLSMADKPQGNGQAGANRGEIIQRLRAADTNGDGQVTLEEARAAFPNAPQERFAKLDRNGDGVLSMADRPNANN